MFLLGITQNLGHGIFHFVRLNKRCTPRRAFGTPDAHSVMTCSLHLASHSDYFPEILLRV